MEYNIVEQTIPSDTVGVMLHVLMALSDAQASAARISELESDALSYALGLTGGAAWPNADEAVDSIDILRGRMVEVVDPLACALCCVTNLLSADNCAKKQ
ncbi:MAG: hypothetical protein LBH66_07205 [Oscillospiraceae bacterium]|jgi:hypothetical protein|nr:hypothetical protein [Oscillospiraceae bacterium]